MPHRNQGRKKSNFPASNVVDPTASMDFFTSGLNTKIAYADFVAGLGVTGTIVQDGAVTGTPVLDPQGSVNNIRNVEDGPGIKSSVSPENGLALEHNFLPGSGGAEVFVDRAQPQPKIKNLVPGPGISVDGSDPDNIVIGATGFAPSTNIVNVFDINDFPPAVGDLITLVPGTTYKLQGLINLGSARLMMADLVVMSTDSRLAFGLASATTGPLITTGNGDAVVIEDMVLSVPAGSYLATSGFGDIVIQNIIGTGCGVISALGPMNTITFGPLSLLVGSNEGFLFSGAHNQFNIYRGFYSTWNGVLFDFGSATFAEGITFGTGVRMVGGVGDTFFSGLAGSGNIAVGATALVLGNKFLGDGTRLAGITNSDARWQFLGNDTIGDTRPDGLLSMQGNATPTVITSVGVGVLAAGIWVVESTSQMTGTTGGRLTYDPDRAIPLPVLIAATVEPVTGNNIVIGVSVALNGTIIPNSKRLAETDAGAPTSVTMPWLIEFGAGDFVELFITNETNTANILVSTATFQVN